MLLQVMKIPSIVGSKSHDTALWDSASTGILVRNAHAIEMGFPCQKKRLRVIVLGGDVKEIDCLLYQCRV